MDTSKNVELPKRPSGMTRQEWRRKQREKKSNIPTIKLVACPKCNKSRLGKYLGEDGKPLPISLETVDVRGEKRLVDICQFCVERYRQEDQRFIMKNLQKIQTAMRNRKAGSTNEKDFSIDL